MDDNLIFKISDNDTKWNIVDVRGGDGLFHRGCIVGVTPEGLIIDFNSEIQEVSYGLACHSRQLSFFRDNEKRPTSEYPGRLVEVLLRCGSDKRCKWYPGTLLFGDITKDQSFGLVRVYFPNRTECLAVPGNRFRTACPEAVFLDSVVKEGQLVDRSSVSEIPKRKETFEMDQWSRGDGTIHLWGLGAMGSENRRIYNVDQLNQRVLRRDKRWIVVTDIGERVLYVKNVMASNAVMKHKIKGGGFQQHLQRYARFARFLAARMFRASRVLLEGHSQIDMHDGNDSNLHGLSHNVLFEIFGCLDSADQAGIRAVCAGWHKALTSRTVRRVLLYTYGRKEDKTYQGEYHLAQYLLKYWCEETQVIAVAGSDESFVSRTGQYIEIILREKKLSPVEQLLLYKQHIESDKNRDVDDLVEDLSRTLIPFFTVCSNLVLKNVSAFRGSRNIPFVVHFKHAHITANQLECEQRRNLWERLDTSCPDLENKDRLALAAWIHNFTDPERRGVYSRYRTVESDHIVKVLTTIQGLDPRKDVHYRLQKWQPDQLVMLDLGKLTRLTTYALHATLHRKPMPIEVCW